MEGGVRGRAHLQASAHSGLTGIVIWISAWNRGYKIPLTDGSLGTAIYESLQWYTVDLDWDAKYTKRIRVT